MNKKVTITFIINDNSPWFSNPNESMKWLFKFLVGQINYVLKQTNKFSMCLYTSTEFSNLFLSVYLKKKKCFLKQYL